MVLTSVGRKLYTRFMNSPKKRVACMERSLSDDTMTSTRASGRED